MVDVGGGEQPLMLNKSLQNWTFSRRHLRYYAVSKTEKLLPENWNAAVVGCASPVFFGLVVFWAGLVREAVSFWYRSHWCEISPAPVLPVTERSRPSFAAWNLHNPHRHLFISNDVESSPQKAISSTTPLLEMRIDFPKLSVHVVFTSTQYLRHAPQDILALAWY